MKKKQADKVLTLMGYECDHCHEMFFTQHISNMLCCPKVLCDGLLTLDGYYEFKNAKDEVKS